MHNPALSEISFAPSGWQRFLTSAPLVGRYYRQSLRRRDVTITTGAAKGLQFNAANSNAQYALGTNEVPVQAALATYLRPGDVFFDVGANVGFFTVIGARLVGAQGRVVAFEPVPENAAAVRYNLALNGFEQVEVWETAVSETNGSAQLQLAHYAGGASLDVAAPPPDFKGTLAVKTVTLDALIQQQRVPVPSLVKIDVEGAELHVLRGMQNTLEQHRPIVIYEVDDGSRAAFDAKRQACGDFMQAYGYRLTPLADAYADAGWLVENVVAVA